MIKAILFDLDGTLLPLDQDIFMETYIGIFVKKMAEHGYDGQKFLSAMVKSISALASNDGSVINEMLIRDLFISELGQKIADDQDIIDEFYEKDFSAVRAVCGYNTEAVKTVKELKEHFRLVLATMPAFPETATRARVRWAGLDFNDFEFVTTYENSYTCKPNPAYYLEISKKLGVSPDECLMVGNDVTDDMVAEDIGMKVFLLTDDLVNRGNADISRYERGSFAELREYVRTISDR